MIFGHNHALDIAWTEPFSNSGLSLPMRRPESNHQEVTDNDSISWGRIHLAPSKSGKDLGRQCLGEHGRIFHLHNMKSSCHRDSEPVQWLLCLCVCHSQKW